MVNNHKLFVYFILEKKYTKVIQQNNTIQMEKIGEDIVPPQCCEFVLSLLTLAGNTVTILDRNAKTVTADV